MEPAIQDTATTSILYVEDDEHARNLLLSMLLPKYPRQQFHVAGNGLQGLERFRELHPPIVITDISMPGMDGISMAAAIKEIAPQTIVIAVTAHSETDNLLRAIEIGINNYLLKPLDYERVCTTLDQAIATVTKEQRLRDQYEQITSLNATLTDRTRELEELNCELEAFNYTVAHDLRSPMVSISGFSQYLMEALAGKIDATCDECLQMIHKETMRMNRLIEALLNFSGYTHKNMSRQLTDLSSIAAEIRNSLLLREPERQATFTIAEGVQGFADPTLLAIVLDNLLGNAWKYTGKNRDTTIEFGATRIGEELVYYVRDNGAGFDPQETARLFAPFQRLQCNLDFQGFGIGLATVSRIIQRHGGRIWAEGEKGRGATFYFTLGPM